MAPDLPEDILHLLCEELYNRDDFDTLFQCTTTAKILASPALTALYRAQHVAKVKADSENEAIPLAEQELVVQKWSILWRSIILSALGKTVLPYCKHIKVLDLEDLKELLRDDRFRGKIAENFFSGDLAQFNVPFETPSKPETRSGKPRPRRLDILSIVDSVGELITEHAPMLEEINGELLPITLVRWIPRLPKLRSLTVWDGEALGEERISNLIHKYCPKFTTLAIYMWIHPDCDQKLSRFFSGLPDQTLQTFTTYSRTGFGPMSCLALNNHGKSLKTLEIQLDSDVIPHLDYLKGCTALETLKLSDYSRIIDLESTQNDVFLAVIAWLLECRNLHTLALNGFISGAALAIPLLMEEGINLEQLDISNYAAKDQETFHKALTHQSSSLQRLILDSEPIEYRDGLDILTHSLCQLKQLRTLRLIGVSSFFNDNNVSAIAEKLELLEDLYVGGQLIDTSLESIALLKNLRSVAFSGITFFTLEGLMYLVDGLGNGNRGIVLAVDNVDPDSGLSESEQAYIRQMLAEKVDGRFEYTLYRDPNISEFEGESD